MPFIVYKIMHILGISLYFSQYAMGTKQEKAKLPIILSGVGLVLILVSALGLMARLGISHGGAWPLWIKLKFSLWVLVGVSGHVVLKRIHKASSAFYWVLLALIGIGAYLANAKLM